MKTPQVKQSEHSLFMEVRHLPRDFYAVMYDGYLNTRKPFQAFSGLLIRCYMKDQWLRRDNLTHPFP